jgi:amidase
MPLPLPEYDQLDALALAARVAAREVSPEDLVEAAIARVEARDPALNAVTWRSFDRARAEARAASARLRSGEPLPPFFGVPFLLKDIGGQDAGEPCTFGSRAMGDWRPPRDAELVARYKRAGLLVIGRTNVPEFGLYAVTESERFGPARNPWDPGHTPGGSSGGAAAAVAARMVPLAHAGDGGGSIRIPAAHCGLVGLKPTRARNPAGPFAGDRWGGLVAEHVVTRSVRDCAAALDATAGSDPGAPYQVLPPEEAFAAAAARGALGQGRRLRIAFTRDALLGDTTHPDNVAAVEQAAALAASLGHTVFEARPPFDRDAVTTAYFTHIAAHTALSVRLVEKLTGRQPSAEDFERPTWLLRTLGETLPAASLAAAAHTAHLTGRAMAAFFDTCDVLLTATAARPPVRIGEMAPAPHERLLMRALSATPVRAILERALRTMARKALAATPNTMLFNLTGQPAISLPLAWNAGGLPIGTQWVGRFGDEATLLALAAELEVAAPWGSRLPPGLG